MVSSLPTVSHPHLSICTFVGSEAVTQSLKEFLSSERYWVTQASSSHSFFDFIEQHKQQLDCLILQNEPGLLPVVNQLYEKGILLPVVIIQGDGLDLTTQKSLPIHASPEPETIVKSEDSPGIMTATHLYHAAEVQLLPDQIAQIASAIDLAIKQFLTLAPTCRLPHHASNLDPITELTTQNFLMLQQRRLTEKLKERLGYLGVYYKRNPQTFFRYLSRAEKLELLEQLRSEYRQIVLNYFSKESTLNQQIDQFVTTAFFADMSVSQIVEIHMELMDEFSKQLKLEGRSEEILLDYRLTLIDILAHLCEMYRRSIPRES